MLPFAVYCRGFKSKNTGQRSRYYVKDSHPAIVSAEVFDKVQEDMARRARFVHKEDGTVESSVSKYNGKYPFGNLLVCGDYGASYRRRTERGKVVCENGVYDEGIIRNKVDKIQIFNAYVMICYENGSQEKMSFKND